MTLRIAALYRYPLKGFSPERLDAVDLLPGQTIAHDRAFAIENGPSGFDPAAPAHLPKIRFLMLMRNEAVANIASRFDPATRTLSFSEPGQAPVVASVDTPEGRAAIEAWVSTRFASDLRGAPRFLEAPGHSFSDVAKKVLHVVNLATVRAIEEEIGRPVDPLRFRANLYLDGLPAWEELELIGREFTVGGVRLEAVKRTVRCAATNVDPSTASRDMEIPRTIMGLRGHSDCGIYVEVKTPGRIAVGDAMELAPERQPELPL